MNNDIYRRAKRFKDKYGLTVCARIKKHSKVIQSILDEDEQVLYVFCGQKNSEHSTLFQSCVIALTSKRILIGQKRVLWGYFITSITPEMFNDLKIYANLVWGKIEIDTAKERVFVSNLDKNSLDEIETNVNKIMLENKRRIFNTDRNRTFE